jgi:hypothetical protein
VLYFSAVAVLDSMHGKVKISVVPFVNTITAGQMDFFA